MEECFFIDENGKKIYDPKIESHIGLAEKILKDNPILKEQFKESGFKDPVDFLLKVCKLIKVTNQAYYRKIVFNSSLLSNAQKKLIRGYVLDGYMPEDIRDMDMRGGEDR